LTRLHPAARSSFGTAAKFSSASCWTSPSLNVAFIFSYSALRCTQNFVLWGFKWVVGRQSDHRVSVPGEQTDISKRLICSLYIFVTSYSSTFATSDLYVMLYTYPTKAPFKLFWHRCCVPGDLYIVVRRNVGNNNWFGLRIWNQLLPQTRWRSRLR
jgi:hypothetical protein